MGKPGDKRRMAQRPGKRERARVKKHRRGRCVCHVGDSGIVYEFRAGRKKSGKVGRYLDKLTHLGGESQILKSGTVIKRPLYTITVA